MDASFIHSNFLNAELVLERRSGTCCRSRLTTRGFPGFLVRPYGWAASVVNLNLVSSDHLEKEFMNPSVVPMSMRWTSDGILVIGLTGDWLVRQIPGAADSVADEVSRAAQPRGLAFDASQLGRWDSALVSFAIRCFDLCQRTQIEFQDGGLPAGVRKLIGLAQSVPEKRDARRVKEVKPWVERVGDGVIGSWLVSREAITFLGEVVLAVGRLLRRQAQFRWSDTMLVMQACGPEALGVVALINFLVGLILAFVGAVQLSQFGAAIYVADLVAIATVREMGCLMTAIILCGRTGAAFAAQLGTMKVNEEIDAFRTFGISSVEFLVLPRVVGLFLMVPLLCIFADLIAILGGFVVSTSMLDVGVTEYIDRTLYAITLRSFLLGIGKGAFFGVLVAMTGCFRGLRSGDSAAAVGLATTSAVVTGITTIIAADGIFAVLCYILGI